MKLLKPHVPVTDELVVECLRSLGSIFAVTKGYYVASSLNIVR